MKATLPLAARNYISDKNLMRRRVFASHYQPQIDLVKEVVKMLGLKGKEKILDVGCGNGDMLIEIRKKYHHRGELTGVDLSAGLIEKANFLNGKNRAGIKFLQMDGRKLLLPDEEFNVVTIKHVLHNVDKPEKVIKESYRVLKPGGKLAIVVTGQKTRTIQRGLYPQIAKILGKGSYPYAEKDVNAETIGNYLEKIFPKFRIKKLEAKIILKSPDLYVDYFDTSRDFWGETSDEKWQRVLDFFRGRLEKILQRKGVIKDYATLAIALTRKP